MSCELCDCGCCNVDGLMGQCETECDLCEDEYQGRALEIAPDAILVIREITSMMAGVSDSHTLARETLLEMINNNGKNRSLLCVECGGYGCLPVLFGDSEPKCLWCVVDSNQSRGGGE